MTQTTGKKVLSLGSHKLSDYQRCAKLYEYESVINIEPKASYKPFAIGTFFAYMLEKYYKNKKAMQQDNIRAKEIEINLKALASTMFNDCRDANVETDDETWNTTLADVLTVRDYDLDLYANRIKYYHNTYLHENWRIGAVEEGFSFILYEDDEYLFVYEGRPDLIVKVDGKLVVVDHKTRSMNKDLLAFNNQVMGYLITTRANYFVYNYIGWQQNGGAEKYFQRQPVMFSEEQQNAWKLRTIEWFKRIAWSEEQNTYLQSMNCDGKYGPCRFISLCSANDKNEQQLQMSDKFKKKEEIRKSW